MSAPSPDTASRGYWAFISYSHRDQKWAGWLHRELETYRVPKRFVGTETAAGVIPARLYPIFRDREELPVSADLSRNVNEALRQSQFLIVVCSPAAAASRWVNEEVLAFKRLGRADRILALIVGGEPNASDGKAGFAIEDECFPKALRFELGEDRELSDRRTEPVAADVRPGQDGRENSKLKIVAGILGVRFSDLRQREHERHIRRLEIITTVTALLVLLFAALGVALFFQRNYAREQKAVAQSALAEVRRTLGRSDYLQAVESAGKAAHPEALAHLARAMRTDPRNGAAVELTLSALTQLHWALPASQPVALGDNVELAAFDPPMQQMLTISSDDTWSVWSLARGVRLTGPVRAGRVVYAAFSPQGDRVVTVVSPLEKSGAFVQMWDARSGQPVGQRIPTEIGESSAVFSPDGGTVLTSGGTVLKTWDARTGAPMPLSIDHGGIVNFAAFSPDGARIVSARLFELLFWDARSGQPQAEAIKQDAFTKSVTFHPDGTTLGIVNWDNSAVLWDGRSRTFIGEAVRHQGYVNMLSFSPDGRRAITSSDDGKAIIIDVADSTPAMEALRHAHPVIAAAFDGNGTQAITVSGGYGAAAQWHRWDLRSSPSGAARLEHRGRVTHAAFSRDGRRVATASADNTARVWDVETKAPVGEPVPHADEVSFCVFSPDGEVLVTGAGYAAYVWELRTGKLRGTPLAHEGRVTRVDFTPDGGLFVTSALDGTARVWHTANAQPVAEPARHSDHVVFVNLSPDGSRFVTASSDNTARIWEIPSARPLAQPLKHDDDVTVARFSPDGRLVVTGSKDKSARLWDAATGAPVGVPMPHEQPVTAAAFSTNGRWVVTAAGEFGAPGAARVWDAKTGRPVAEALRHENGVTSVTFDPDGQRIITGSFDAQVRVWDTETGKARCLPRRCDDLITHLELDASGRHMLIASGNAALLLDVPDTTEPAPMWLPRLAEKIGGLAVSDAGLLETVADRSLDALREELGRVSNQDGYARFVRGLLHDAPGPESSPKR